MSKAVHPLTAMKILCQKGLTPHQVYVQLRRAVRKTVRFADGRAYPFVIESDL